MTNHTCEACSPGFQKQTTSSSGSSNNEYKLHEISAGEFWNLDFDTKSYNSEFSLREDFSKMGTGHTETNGALESQGSILNFEYRKNSHNRLPSIWDLKQLLRNYEPQITPRRHIGFEGFLRFRHNLGKDYSCWPEWAFYVAGFLGEPLPSFATKVRERCPTILLMDHLTPKYLKSVQQLSAEDAKFHLFLPFFQNIDARFDTYTLEFLKLLTTLLTQHVKLIESNPAFMEFMLEGLEKPTYEEVLDDLQRDISHMEITEGNDQDTEVTETEKDPFAGIFLSLDSDFMAEFVQKAPEPKKDKRTKDKTTRKTKDSSRLEDSFLENTTLPEIDPAPQNSFEAIMNTLTDLFPTLPHDELKVRLQSSLDIEYLIDTLFAEQERNLIQEYSLDAYRLHEMFPSHSLQDLERELIANNGNIEIATIGILLNKWEHKAPSRPLPKKEPKKPTNSSWSSFSDFSAQLSKITGLPVTMTSSYLHRSQGSFINALIAIIMNHKAPAPQPTNDKPPRGGRVQRGGARGGSKRGNGSRESPPPYKFNPNSAEAQELRALYLSNPEMKTINEVFVNTALTFFKGNVDRTVEIIMLVLDHGAAALTYPDSKQGATNAQKIVVSTKPVIDLSSQSSEKYRAMYNILTQRITNQTSSGTKDHYREVLKESRRQFWQSIASEEEERKQRAIDAGFKTLSLDLHGLLVPSALEATREVLNAWWAYEKEQRYINGQLSKYGVSTVFAGPLRVITGRGIHSKNGVSQVKIQVRKLLDLERYAYHDDGGSYAVYGKRK